MTDASISLADLKDLAAIGPCHRRVPLSEWMGPVTYSRFVAALEAERREIYRRLKEAAAAKRATATPLCLCGAALPATDHPVIQSGSGLVVVECPRAAEFGMR